jgi:succinoglycan biosynthesis protein ExoW
MKIAVIIPYFQRDAGLLSKALQSVFAQNLPLSTELWVIVVDDDSPAPAASAIEGLPHADRRRITLRKQANAGPGQARNAALDLVADRGADYVAFLDSDDIWKPDHLRDAVAALEAGFDFYFCDHRRFEDTETYASTLASPTLMRRPDTPGFRVIDPVGPVTTVDRDVVLAAYLQEYLSQTSTIVLRQSAVQTLRFEPELRRAGEDYLFWIRVVFNHARVAMSGRVNVLCGRGLNLYFSAFDFASVSTVDRIGCIFLFWHKCAELFVADAQKAECIRMQRRYLRAYSYMFMRALLRGQRPDMLTFRAVWKRIPFMPVAMPFRFLAVLPRRHVESKLW